MQKQKQKQKQRKVFEVTRGQIWFILILAAVGLAIVFEVGVSVGKKRIINAERESLMGGDVQASAQSKKPTKSVAKPDEKAASGGDQPLKIPEPPPKEGLKAETDNAKYAIQVGAFRDRENAEKLVKLLNSYEYVSWLKTESSAGETVHSVLVGKFATRDDADYFGKSIKERLSYITDYRIRDIEGGE